MGIRFFSAREWKKEKLIDMQEMFYKNRAPATAAFRLRATAHIKFKFRRISMHHDRVINFGGKRSDEISNIEEHLEGTLG